MAIKKVKKFTIITVICLCLNIFSCFTFAEVIQEDTSSEEILSAFEETLLNESYVEPEEWFTDSGLYLDTSNYNNMYRSVSGNFYGDSKDEILRCITAAEIQLSIHS